MLFRSSSLFPAATAQTDGKVEEMAQTGRQILEHPEFRERRRANQSFRKALITYVRSESGFDDPLAEVTNMLRLELGDEARIFTWQMPDSLYKYQRFGVVAVRQKDSIIITELTEVEDVESMQFRQLKPGQWYGALYYESIPESKRRAKFYTLLGYAPGQEINEKFVDVIEIDKNGRPVFGAKVFRVDQFMDRTLNRPPMRLILKYGGNYTASVRWLEDEEMIVMDHLAPPDAKLKGVYRMYGPDMSYDALVWDKNWWHLETEVKFNSGQKIEIRPPDKPLDLPPSGSASEGGRN